MGLIDFKYYSEAMGSDSANWVEKSLPTLVGVFIGFGLNRLYEFVKERNEIKKSGEELINEMELVRETVLKQAESIEITLNQLSSNDPSKLRLVNYIMADTERYKSINRLHVYRYFSKKLKPDSKTARRVVNKLYKSVLVAETESIRMSSYFDEFLSAGTNIHKEFNKALNLLASDFNEMIRAIEKDDRNPKQDEFIMAMFPIVDLIRKNQDKDYIQLIDIFCRPAAEKLNDFSIDDRTIILGRNLKICFQCFNDYNAANKKLIFLLQQLEITYKSLEIEILNNSEILQK